MSLVNGQFAWEILNNFLDKHSMFIQCVICSTQSSHDFKINVVISYSTVIKVKYWSKTWLSIHKIIVNSQ